MIWNCFVLLCCLAVSLGEEYQSYYVPENHHPQVVSEHYSDGAHNGLHRDREYDHGAHRQLQHLQDGHGSRHYGEGDNHALRDFSKHDQHNRGAHEAAHSAGGQESHVRKAHDRGFYEREKKYGYEKAYGYERETRQHDKADNAVSQGSKYQHDANRGHYDHGTQAIKDLATHGNRHKYGSEAHGNRKILIDLTANHNKGRDMDTKYVNEHNLKNIQLVRPEQHTVYRPYPSRRGYDDVDNSLARFRYLSGIHGLGGLRGYGQGYGYTPMRYGYNDMPYNGYANRELMYARQPVVPHTNAFYVKH